jgi:bifunctional UDP-N-acetylglucosamine pyrophosphorylase/glucosamine-1-phosphate N-acetyltransferase
VSDAALILAAGKGTRMRSSLPKVLHRVAGKSMLTRVLDCLSQAGFTHPTAVVGYGAERIRETVGDRCEYVMQHDQLGTGDATRVGVQALPRDATRIVLLHGDEPLLPPEALPRMLAEGERTGAAVVLLTTHLTDTRHFGRVVRDGSGMPLALVQETDLTPEQQEISEVNLGAYVFDAAFLRDSLSRLQPHPPKGEYYLTDVVALAREQGLPVAAITIDGGADVLGINDLVQLEEATQAIYRRTNRRLMEAGVTILDSASTFVDEEATVEPDTIIAPFSMLMGSTHVGRGCEIGPHAHIIASRIGDHCRVVASTIEHSEVGNEVRIGPYSHLRPGASIADRAEIGNYAEIKNSRIGPGSRMHHMSYMGDAQVGANVNIGAGTITCNFDGVHKHGTVIEDNAFVGSDTMLRAPVTIGRGAVTGAGTVVLHDVAPGSRVAGVPGRVIKDAPDSMNSDGAALQSPPDGERGA